ncbi:unnamed protein product [Pedinophyceae sp. YPF-701]|nr:unnamed protein product [Pedinophyceae sp. YPF-701]
MSSHGGGSNGGDTTTHAESNPDLYNFMVADAVQALPECTLLLDASGAVLTASRGARVVFGDDPEYLVGKAILSFLDVAGAAKVSHWILHNYQEVREGCEPHPPECVPVKVLHSEGAESSAQLRMQWIQDEEFPAGAIKSTVPGSSSFYVACTVALEPVLPPPELSKPEQDGRDVLDLGSGSPADSEDEDASSRLAVSRRESLQPAALGTLLSDVTGAPMPFLMLRPAGEVLAVSESFTDAPLGCRAADLRGRNLPDLIHPDDTPAVLKALDDSFRGPRVAQMRVHTQLEAGAGVTGGGSVPVEVLLYRPAWPCTEDVVLAAVMPMHLHLEALAQARRLQVYLEVCPMFIFRANPLLDVVSASELYLQVSGAAADEATGWNILPSIDEADAPEVLRVVKDLQKQMRAADDPETSLPDDPKTSATQARVESKRLKYRRVIRGRKVAVDATIAVVHVSCIWELLIIERPINPSDLPPVEAPRPVVMSECIPPPAQGLSPPRDAVLSGVMRSAPLVVSRKPGARFAPSPRPTVAATDGAVTHTMQHVRSLGRSTSRASRRSPSSGALTVDGSQTGSRPGSRTEAAMERTLSGRSMTARRPLLATGLFGRSFSEGRTARRQPAPSDGPGADLALMGHLARTGSGAALSTLRARHGPQAPWLATGLEAIGGAMLMVHDENGNLLYRSPQVGDVLSPAADSVSERGLFGALELAQGPASAQAVRNALQVAVRDGKLPYSRRPWLSQARHASGRRILLAYSFAFLRAAHGGIQAAVVCRDATDYARGLPSPRPPLSRSGECIATVDLELDAEGRVLRVAGDCVAVLGRLPGAVSGALLLDLVHKGDRALVAQHLTSAVVAAQGAAAGLGAEEGPVGPILFSPKMISEGNYRERIKAAVAAGAGTTVHGGVVAAAIRSVPRLPRFVEGSFFAQPAAGASEGAAVRIRMTDATRAVRTRAQAAVADALLDIVPAAIVHIDTSGRATRASTAAKHIITGLVARPGGGTDPVEQLPAWAANPQVVAEVRAFDAQACKLLQAQPPPAGVLPPGSLPCKTFHSPPLPPELSSAGVSEHLPAMYRIWLPRLPLGVKPETGLMTLDPPQGMQGLYAPSRPAGRHQAASWRGGHGSGGSGRGDSGANTPPRSNLGGYGDPAYQAQTIGQAVLRSPAGGGKLSHSGGVPLTQRRPQRSLSAFIPTRNVSNQNHARAPQTRLDAGFAPRRDQFQSHLHGGADLTPNKLSALLDWQAGLQTLPYQPVVGPATQHLEPFVRQLIYHVCTRDVTALNQALLRVHLDLGYASVMQAAATTPLLPGGGNIVHVAATMGQTAAVTAIAAAGMAGAAALDSVDSMGNTPLHCAAAAGHADCVVQLLTLGLSAATLNSVGQAPADMAEVAGHVQVARLLRQHLAAGLF